MPARCCRTEWGRPRSNSPSAASRGEEAAESPQPGHIALPAPVVSCREKGGVPPQVLALTEFAATIGARQLPFSAELGCWRDKQGGDGRHQFSLCPLNHALRDFPSIFGSLFVLWREPTRFTSFVSDDNLPLFLDCCSSPC